MPNPSANMLSNLTILILLVAPTLAIGQETAAPSSPPDSLPAFSEAAGFGSTTPGGRGGRVLIVTNLEDYDPAREESIRGSLRWALAKNDPRVVVFAVSGTIELNAPLNISDPYLTIAGQTAPGGGICIKNYGTTIRTHDVVVRYLRFRPGDEPGRVLHEEGKNFENDGLTITKGARNVIIDHCSISWAIDECFDIWGEGTSNITAQWCIISESLNDSFHSKGPHGYGALIRCNGNVSLHHNMFAHHRSRSPRPGTIGPGTITFDFRNNVIHDSTGYSSDDPLRMNYVANFIRRPRSSAAFSIGGSATSVHAKGNLFADRQSALKSLMFKHPQRGRPLEKPIDVPPVETQSARAAYAQIMRHGGASLPKRDAVDSRIISQVRRGKVGLIDSQSDVGGWPALETAPPPPDSDQDGMPDAWETKHGLDPHDASDTNDDANGDGYTNLEDYLNSLGAQNES